MSRLRADIMIRSEVGAPYYEIILKKKGVKGVKQDVG